MLNDRINGGYSFVNRGSRSTSSSGKEKVITKLEQIEKELEELKLFNKSIRDLAEASITILPEPDSASE